MNELSKQIGTKIQQIRKQQQLSQEYLGELANLTKNYIGLLERGRRNPTLQTLAQIAKALNVPLEALFDF